MKKREKKIGEQLYITMAIAFVLVVVAFALYTFFIGRKIRENNHQYLKNDTWQSAENIEYILGEGYDNIKVLSELISQSLTSKEVDISSYQKIINNSVFDFVEFADKNGMDHNITGGVSDARDRKYYLDAMEGNTGMEIIFNSRATHENLIMFYSPVYYGEEIIGSLVGVYEGTNKITQILSKDYFGERAISYLCTTDGRVFASSIGLDTSEEHYIADLLSINDKEKGKMRKRVEEGKDYSFLLYGNIATGYMTPMSNNEWLLVQIYPSQINKRMMNEMLGLALGLVCMIMAIFIWNQHIVYRSHKNQEKMIESQFRILKSVSDIYHSMHLINMEDLTVVEYEANELLKSKIAEGVNAIDMMEKVMHATMSAEYLEIGLEFTDITTLKERLKGKKIIFADLLGRNEGWIRMSFITIEADENQVPTKVIVATQVIDEEKKRENELTFKANNDELTGLYNRRAYEDDLLYYPDVPPEQDFIYASIDINGLKVVNDTLGHAAGDELISGAAKILKNTLGNYGKVYRTGGDEFVSMFFADEEHLEAVLEELRLMADDWEGKLTNSLSFSIGCASKREFPTATVEEMAKIADKRMYEDKKLYYSRRGIDRRGQAAAHTALCRLYNKILKINITTDSYTIVNMDLSEQIEEKGYSGTISEWLYRFGISGQVHKDDLEEYLQKTNITYLRDYFAGDKTSISISYRRKFEDKFKWVMMEIIPADDYASDNQSLYLYVRQIDK